MKKSLPFILIAVAFLSLSTGVFAQTKIGYINTEELIGSMPETETANTQLQEYQSTLQEQGNEYYRELSEKDSTFQADSAKYTQTQKELKRNDLIALYQKVQGWNQTMQQMIQEKSQTLIVPIRSKALDAVKAVAKENGYAYVLEEAAVLSGPANDNILPLVRKKLGIKEPAPRPAAGAGLKKP